MEKDKEYNEKTKLAIDNAWYEATLLYESDDCEGDWMELFYQCFEAQLPLLLED